MRMLSSWPKENVIILFEVAMLVGRTGCTLRIPYSVYRLLVDTHPCRAQCESCSAIVEYQDT